MGEIESIESREAKTSINGRREISYSPNLLKADLPKYGLFPPFQFLK